MARVDLRDKPMCITGASAGIGRATALACARAGMPVVVTARRADRLASVVAEIKAQGGRAVAVVGDVIDAAGSRRMIEVCVESFGSVYGVFANAGYGFEAPFAETSEEAMREIFEVNFWGTVHAARAALPVMREAGRGHVLMCSSVIGVVPVPRYGVYCATKAAQHHVGRALAAEVRGEGVYVSTVHPAWTRTEFGEVVRSRSGMTSSDRKPGWLVQSPEVVAKRVVGCLRRPRVEVWTSLPVRLACGVCVAFPGLADRVVARAVGG